MSHRPSGTLEKNLGKGLDSLYGLTHTRHMSNQANEGQAMYYTVKTANGYVGRGPGESTLTDTQPAVFAYTWDTQDEAERIASQFAGEVVAH